MQFSSFLSFNIWTCSCANASLSLFNRCFWDCLLPYFTVVAEKEGPAGSILQKEINVCLRLPLPPSSHSRQKLSGTLAGLLMVWRFGAEYDSQGVKGHTLGGPMTSLLRWPMHVQAPRQIFGVSPQPPSVWNWVCLHQWFRVKKI